MIKKTVEEKADRLCHAIVIVCIVAFLGLMTWGFYG